MIELAGLPFAVEPEASLNRHEQVALHHWTGASPARSGTAGHPPFRLTLADEQWLGHDPPVGRIGEPAAVAYQDGQVRITHALFLAALDPEAGHGRLYRRSATAFPLEVTLRVALCCRLPAAGGLPLHAAGIVAHGQGLVFFGPSGAGKSTLAATSPHPVLSDELVAVQGDPPRLRATGFWGAMDNAGDRCPPRQQAPLRALLALDRGPATAVTPVEPAEAVRLLLPVLMIPAAPPVWQTAIALAGALASTLPVYRLAWSPSLPPWPEIAATLGL